MTDKDSVTEKKLITKKILDSASKVKKKTSDKASELGEYVGDSCVGKVAETTKNISYETFEKTSTKIGDISQKIIDSRAGETAQEIMGRTVDEMQVVCDVYTESAPKKAADFLIDQATDKMDTISGVKILEEVRKRLSVQDEYNDILATRLAEALERIATLEKEIAQLKGK